MGKPDIVFILIDDLGGKDLRFRGGEFHENPNPDWRGR
jgi:arylsulfatase A-like enzyme